MEKNKIKLICSVLGSLFLIIAIVFFFVSPFVSILGQSVGTGFDIIMKKTDIECVNEYGYYSTLICFLTIVACLIGNVVMLLMNDNLKKKNAKKIKDSGYLALIISAITSLIPLIANCIVLSSTGLVNPIINVSTGAIVTGIFGFLGMLCLTISEFYININANKNEKQEEQEKQKEE